MAGGYRSPLAFWVGGASAPPAPAAQAGYRGLLAPWVGGASSPSTAGVQAADRGLLAFWLGGSAAIAAPPVEPPAPGADAGGGLRPRRRVMRLPPRPPFDFIDEDDTAHDLGLF